MDNNNGKTIRTRRAMAIGIDIPADYIVMQSASMARVVLREDEARDLRDAIDKQLAEAERINRAVTGRPVGYTPAPAKPAKRKTSKSKSKPEPTESL